LPTIFLWNEDETIDRNGDMAEEDELAVVRSTLVSQIARRPEIVV
jgi:hypothetical protein